MNQLNVDIITAARSFIGTPWKHQGRTRNGIDCVGLIICVARETGRVSDEKLASIDYAYPRRPDGSLMIKLFANAGCAEVAYGVKQDGDILVFAEHAFPCHVGFLDNEHIIHAYTKGARKVIKEPLVNRIKDLVTIFRLPEVKL